MPKPKVLTIQDIKFNNLREVAKAYNIKRGTLISRLFKGWDIEEAIGIKERDLNRKAIAISGHNFSSITEASEYYKTPQLADRLRRGWSPEEAVGLQSRTRKFKNRRVYSEAGREKIRIANYQRWLADAKRIHFCSDSASEKFDYRDTKDSYVKQKTPPISIFCKQHEKRFLVTPHDHLKRMSGGCPDCIYQIRSDRTYEKKKLMFSRWFEKHHGDRLEFVTEFKGMVSKMQFKCKIHKTTKWVKPTELMSNGYWGCDSCAKDSAQLAKKSDPSSLTSELNPLLPENVSITEILFDQSTKIKITCQQHGVQIVTADYLRNSKHKCPECGRQNIGFTEARLRTLVENNNEGLPCFLGLMEVDVFGIRALKVGVTIRTLEERYAYHLKKIFFSIQIPERDAYIIENKIHRIFEKEKDERIFKAGMRSGKRWGGDTELYWFRNKEKIINSIKSELEKLKVEKPDYWTELSLYQLPDITERDVSRSKDDNNKPVKVLGVNPETNEIQKKFISIAEATRAGFHGVSQIIAGSGSRRLAGGLRWFKETDFDPNKIPPLRKDGQKKAVIARQDHSTLLGIDPETLIIKEKFATVRDAEKAGFSNVKQSIYSGNKRPIIYGLRWEFQNKFIQNSKAIKYTSISEAIRGMGIEGYAISQKGIKSSIRNDLPDRNGFRWEFSN